MSARAGKAEDQADTHIGIGMGARAGQNFECQGKQRVAGGKSSFNWDQDGEAYRDVVLDRVQQLLIPDLRERLDTVFHYSPADFERDLGAHLGSAFSLEPLLTQSAYFRAHNRDDHFANLYFVGAGTHPGAGIPGVVGSAKATASLML